MKFVDFEGVTETASGTYYTCSWSRSKMNESVSLRASTTMEWGESISMRTFFLMMTSCCYLTPISMGKRIQSISLALLNRSFRRSTKIRRRWWQWTEIRANGKDLSTTDKFTYLGSTDRRDGKEHKDINNRLGMTRNAFRILKNTLKFQQYSIKIKVNVYQSCISELYPIIMPWMLKNYRR